MAVKLEYNANSGSFDLSVVNGSIKTSADLETAIIISLFSDARSDEPFINKNSRGYWADILPGETGKTGSLWWLLQRSTITNNSINRARDWAIEALQWLLADGIAKSVDVQIMRVGIDSWSATVKIVRPSGDSKTFSYLWKPYYAD